MVGFWSDTFGGGYAVMGHGRSASNGFEVTYPYPDDSFVNRWRLEPGSLKWVIVERSRTGAEKPFAAYSMVRTPCS